MAEGKSFLESPIEYLKGVGPSRAELLQKELKIFTFRDLLLHFPFRYIDKTKFQKIAESRTDGEYVQFKGTLTSLAVVGQHRKSRLVGRLQDDTGSIELVWFQGVRWLKDSLRTGLTYIAFGKTNNFRGKISLPHPEMELEAATPTSFKATFSPVYSSTEKLAKKGLDTKGLRKLAKQLLQPLRPGHVYENLPDYLLGKMRFPSRFEALTSIHFPKDNIALKSATRRLKFEELFYLQLGLLRLKSRRKEEIKGFVFEKVGDRFNQFYSQNLPFELTGAQKRVLKEIRYDLGKGVQMNRLLQGDVGSGKTVVALMSMLIALDNGFQACLMAPTEILAQQHYKSISNYLKGLGIRVAFLSGTVKGKKRKELLNLLSIGELDILIGTHALIEEPVEFQNLGFAIIDEQHRFGVAQRAKLWKKSEIFPPHVLVMTATPIPRTLAMTVYGDLDISIIDEMPPGRKEIKTLHTRENHRLKVIGMMRNEIKAGRQIYIVYPLIEESETLDLLNLQEGYDAMKRDFPPPDYQISVVHGRMKSADKEFEMKRFSNGETQILIATTVIEVGVDVPNASLMLIENAERFGLSQLHQLRGRVGRGAEQSYCILMSKYELSKDARERIKIMCETNDGFKIAEADLRLRGPGNILGTQQSGSFEFRIANLLEDSEILKTARDIAIHILSDDPGLVADKNKVLKQHLETKHRGMVSWSRIS